MVTILQIVLNHLKAHEVSTTTPPGQWIHIHHEGHTKGYIDFNPDGVKLRHNMSVVNNGHGYTITLKPDIDVSYADPELLDKISNWVDTLPAQPTNQMIISE